MQGNKAKDTKPELILRKALRHSGMIGYRLHWKKAPGRPDLSYPGRKLAVFVHGCYWHRCPHCQLSLPKSHQEFWKAKFEANVARDEKKQKELLDQGWKFCVIWECEIKKDLDASVQVIRERYDEAESR